MKKWVDAIIKKAFLLFLQKLPLLKTDRKMGEKGIGTATQWSNLWAAGIELLRPSEEERNGKGEWGREENFSRS